MSGKIFIWLLVIVSADCLLHRRGAAAGKNLSHRFPGSKHCFR